MFFKKTLSWLATDNWVHLEPSEMNQRGWVVVSVCLAWPNLTSPIHCQSNMTPSLIPNFCKQSTLCFIIYFFLVYFASSVDCPS